MLNSWRKRQPSEPILPQGPAFEPADVELSAREEGPGRALLVYPGRAWDDDLAAALRAAGWECACVLNLEQAEAALETGTFDLVITDVHLTDGTGLDLAEGLPANASAKAVLVNAGGVDGETAIRAMQHGVLDLVALPIDAVDFVQRMGEALRKSRDEQQRQSDLRHLKSLCRKLHDARNEVSAQVDTLCHDLADAYREIADQMNEVAMSSEFRTLISQELDIEDLLRTALEYMLTKTGPTNAAIFLPNAANEFALGAYVNYDLPRDSIGFLLDHMANQVCPTLGETSEIQTFEHEGELEDFLGVAPGGLGDCEVAAFACRHEDECLATFFLFRRRSEPFDPTLLNLIETLRPIFAEQVTKVINVHHRCEAEWPEDDYSVEDDLEDDYDNYGFGGLAA